MGGVSEKRESEGHEAPADTLQCVVSLDFSEYLSQSSQNNRSDDVSHIRFACYQEQDEDESVENCHRTEAADAGAGEEIDERGQQRQQSSDIRITCRVDSSAAGTEDECGEIGHRH